MNWFIIFQIMSILKDEIEKAAEDKQITLSEALQIVSDVINKTGLGDTVIVTPKMIEDIKKKLHI